MTMTEANDYFVAVARSFRDRIPKNWLEILSAIEDVEIVNATEFRARIKAPPPAVERIRQQFRDALQIEAVVRRKPL